MVVELRFLSRGVEFITQGEGVCWELLQAGDLSKDSKWVPYDPPQVLLQWPRLRLEIHIFALLHLSKTSLLGISKCSFHRVTELHCRKRQYSRSSLPTDSVFTDSSVNWNRFPSKSIQLEPLPVSCWESQHNKHESSQCTSKLSSKWSSLPPHPCSETVSQGPKICSVMLALCVCMHVWIYPCVYICGYPCVWKLKVNPEYHSSNVVTLFSKNGVLFVYSFIFACLFVCLKIVSHYRAVALAGLELTEIICLFLINTVIKDRHYQTLLKAGSYWPETHQIGKAGSLASSCNLSIPSSIELAWQASITAPSSRDKMLHASILSTDLATQTRGRIFCYWLICFKWHRNSAAMCSSIPEYKVFDVPYQENEC